MLYEEAIKYLGGFVDFEKVVDYNYRKEIGLARIKALLEEVGNPHLGLRVIHIAGTKGKGSSCAMIASILKEAGYKVGLYISPHLINPRERISIDGFNISEEDMASLVKQIKPSIDRVSRILLNKPSLFEIYTTLAFVFFQNMDVDFAVVETGLGGRLDATNVVNPLCCGITPISLEHTQRLGNTVLEIAKEKAGIIKTNSVCISSPQNKEVLNLLRETALKKGCKFFEVGCDINVKFDYFDGAFQVFHIDGIFNKYTKLYLPLLGQHQLINASLAVGIVEVLRYYDIIIDEASIRIGLKNVRWDGRLQIIHRSPFVVVDGAQNQASANALINAILHIFNFRRLILVLGISRDKDVYGIWKELSVLNPIPILTRSKHPRAFDPEELRRLLSLPDTSEITNTVSQAIDRALMVSKTTDLILITGSLFVVGEALCYFPKSYARAKVCS